MKYHLCINIAGMLRNFQKKGSLQGMLTDHGRVLSDAEARTYLNECLAKGWKVIPTNADCDNFDYQTGCRGHKEAADK